MAVYPQFSTGFHDDTDSMTIDTDILPSNEMAVTSFESARHSPDYGNTNFMQSDSTQCTHYGVYYAHDDDSYVEGNLIE